MSGSHHAHHGASPGFSLIEVLVALAIASLMIALIAPLSRHSLRMIGGMERDIALYQEIDPRGDVSEKGRTALTPSAGINGSQRRQRLPPFPYEPSVMEKWQPVLVSLSAEKEGRRLMIEVITLEQERE